MVQIHRCIAACTGDKARARKSNIHFYFYFKKSMGKNVSSASRGRCPPKWTIFVLFFCKSANKCALRCCLNMGQAKMQWCMNSWACDFFFGCSRIKLYKNIIIFIIIFCFIWSHRISFVCAFRSFGSRSHITRTSTQWANNFDLFCCSLTFLSLCFGSPMAGDAECDVAPNAREGEVKNANNN